MSKRGSLISCVMVLLMVVWGCAGIQPETMTVVGGKQVTYRCEGGVRIVARYFSLSDESLHFVKVWMPSGKEYTLPQAVSASGARYTDERELVWWNKGDTAFVKMRDRQGRWQVIYRTCREVGQSK